MRQQDYSVYQAIHGTSLVCVRNGGENGSLRIFPRKLAYETNRK